MTDGTDDPQGKLAVRAVNVDRSQAGVEKVTLRPLVNDRPVGPAVVLTVDQPAGLGIVEAQAQYTLTKTGQ